jgi:hypothetical protein
MCFETMALKQMLLHEWGFSVHSVAGESTLFTPSPVLGLIGPPQLCEGQEEQE